MNIRFGFHKDIYPQHVLQSNVKYIETFLLKAVAVSMLSPNLFAMCSVPRDVLDMTIALSLVLPAGLTAYALWVVAGRGIVSVMQNVREVNF